MKKNYITDLIESNKITKEMLFNNEYYPIIAGGTATGKSTFTCKGMSKIIGCKPSEILLVEPLSAIELQLIEKGLANKLNLDEDFFMMDGVMVCTYNKLIGVIKKRLKIPAQIKYIVFDEAHNLITAESFAQYGTFFFKWLEDVEMSISPLFLTATPAALLTYKYGKKPFKEVLGVKSNVKVGKIIFTTETDLLNHVKYFAKYSEKIFIAVQTVTDAQKLEKQLNERVPSCAVAIFSKTHDKATDEMRTMADLIVKTEQYPEGVKFLIVNSAYIEGMEIQSKVETAIIKQPSITGIVQAVGRLRQGVNDVIVVLAKDKFYALDQLLFDEFNKFLEAYRTADENTKSMMLLGMYAEQMEKHKHELVTVFGVKNYVPDYRINMALYHSLDVRLQDGKKLYCENDEISNEQFEKLENTFRPYFPNTNFCMMTEKGFVSKEEKFNEDLIAFLINIVGNKVYDLKNSNGICVAEVCRKIMLLREQYNLNLEKPVDKLKSLNTFIKPYGFKIDKRNSERDDDGKIIKYRQMLFCTTS